MEDSVEFKDGLHKVFRDTGIVDELKAQMRYKLVDALQSKGQVLQKDSTFKKDKNSLKSRVGASLIAEHLDRQGQTYSLSVYLPESGYNNQILDRTELFEILQLKDINLLMDKNSLLDVILDFFLANKQNITVKTNSATQTEISDSIMNLESKLQMVDLKFKEQIHRELIPSAQSVEEKMNKWKKEYESRMKADMQAELVRIRQFEISSIRIQEAEKSRMEMQEYREELEQKYQEKLQRLRDREKETLDKVQQKMKDLESYNHEHRQKIMRDFELIALRESDLEKQRKLNEERVNVEKLKLETMQKELQAKLREVDEQKLHGERKTETDKQVAKLEVYREVQNEQLEYIQKKKLVEEDLLKINQLKETLNNFRNQAESLSKENGGLVEKNEELKKKKKELEADLKQIRENVTTINESYRREVMNSKNQQEKIRIREEEIEHLKKTISEKEELMAAVKSQQIENIKKYTAEIQNLQNQIEKLEKQNKELREENLQNNEMIQKGIAPQGVPIMAHKHPLDESLNLSTLQQSFVNRMGHLQAQYQQKREQNLRFLDEIRNENLLPQFKDLRGGFYDQENLYPPLPQTQQIYKYSSLFDQPQQPQYQQQQQKQQQQQQQYNYQPTASRKFEGLDKVDFTTSYDQRDDQFGLNKGDRGLIEQVAEDVDYNDRSQRPGGQAQDPKVGKNIFATKKVLSPITEDQFGQQQYLQDDSSQRKRDQSPPKSQPQQQQLQQQQKQQQQSSLSPKERKQQSNLLDLPKIQPKQKDKLDELPDLKKPSTASKTIPKVQPQVQQQQQASQKKEEPKKRDIFDDDDYEEYKFDQKPKGGAQGALRGLQQLRRQQEEQPKKQEEIEPQKPGYQEFKWNEPPQKKASDLPQLKQQTQQKTPVSQKQQEESYGFDFEEEDVEEYNEESIQKVSQFKSQLENKSNLKSQLTKDKQSEIQDDIEEEFQFEELE